MEAVKNNKMLISAFIVAAIFITVTFPDEGVEIQRTIISKFHMKVVIALGAVFLSYYVTRNPKRKPQPIVSFSDTLKMKAMLIRSYGTHRMEIGTMPRPKVTKPYDVLIKVKAASLNPIDFRVKEGYGQELLKKRREMMGFSNSFPIVVGRDCSGEVVEVGSHVSQFKPGDEVWASGSIFHTPGTLAQYFLTSDQLISKKPTNIGHIEAASLPYVITTSWQAFLKAGINATTAKGKRVLILAGTGGVGSIAIQILKAWGCHVTTTCSADGIEMVKRLGADRAIDYKKESLVAAVEDKEKFDFVFCTRGGDDTYKTCLAVCRPGGCVVTIVTSVVRNLDKYGYILGTIKNFIDILKYRHFQKWMYNKDFRYSFHEPDGPFLQEVAELVEAGKVKGCIDRSYEFVRTNEALEKLKEGHARGKFVVSVPQDE